MTDTPDSQPVQVHFATPDVTPAQLKAIRLALATLVGAIGLHFSDHALNLFALVLAVGGPSLGSAIVLADAIIRHGRATGDAMRTHAVATITRTSPNGAVETEHHTIGV